MSADAGPKATDSGSTDSPITASFDIYKRPDHNLVELASMSDFIGTPLTLYMPWGVAAGHTAGMREYYGHLGNCARGAVESADEGWQSAIDEWAGRNFDAFAKMTGEEFAEARFHDGVDMTSFVVLKDAECWVGGSVHQARHEYLRIRLTDITAWAWGVNT